MITLTTEQAQQIEEALEDIVRVFEFETGTPVEALATIRTAKAQEQVEPVVEERADEPYSVFDHLGYCPECGAEKPPIEIAVTEPVAWFCKSRDLFEHKRPSEDDYRAHIIDWQPLYTAPVRTKDLTDDEIEWLVVDTLETWNSKDTMKDFARAVIAAFKEKNK